MFAECIANGGGVQECTIYGRIYQYGVEKGGAEAFKEAQAESGCLICN